MTTFKMARERLRARVIELGRPGEETITVAPKPKPVFEFHGWVLGYKVRTGMVAASLVLAGWLIGAADPWAAFWAAVAVFVFVVIFKKPCT